MSKYKTIKHEPWPIKESIDSALDEIEWFILQLTCEVDYLDQLSSDFYEK